MDTFTRNGLKSSREIENIVNAVMQGSGQPRNHSFSTYRKFFKELAFVNPLTTNVPLHIETSQLICNANQLTGFYMKRDIGR